MIKNFNEFNNTVDEGLGTWLSNAWDWLTGKSEDDNYSENTVAYYKKLLITELLPKEFFVD